MKKVIQTLISFALLMGGINNTQAQQFVNGELSVIKPSQVIIENYIPVDLSKEIVDDVMANRFDINNPYTYLQVVNDATANKCHILFQTNFAGKILFLSYSNNLSTLFNKKNKPVFLLTHCLKDINNYLSSVQIMNAAVKCIVDRLNYCYEN